jgi:hypothetical protein
VFITAVALALATEIRPGDPKVSVIDRATHAVITVAVTLGVLVVADIILRAITYGTTAHKRWQITTREELDGTRLLVRSRDRARQELPPFTEVHVKGPSGFLTPQASDPAVIDGGSPWTTEPGQIEFRQILAPGSYEVRAYSRPDGPELIRRNLDVPEL